MHTQEAGGSGVHCSYARHVRALQCSVRCTLACCTMPTWHGVLCAQVPEVWSLLAAPPYQTRVPTKKWFTAGQVGI